MHFISLFFVCLLSIVQLHSVHIKVPNERYKGAFDKRLHQGHYPFISYLTFRNICDQVIDDSTEWFDPDLVQEGEIIYLNVWYLDWFEKNVHDHIKVPYILVTCDVGAWLPCLEYKKLLYDPKLTAWFCRNMVFSYHPKLFQIPTGQDFGQFILDDPKITYYLLAAILNKPAVKTHLLYMCHFPRQHGERDRLVKQFENEPYCLTRNHSDEVFTGVSRPVFYEDMLSCKFVLSPLGFETDSVRTWEGLVLDCIPIVEHTFLDPSYDNLPVVTVHDWSEVTPTLLEKKYEELKDRKCDEAYFDYWFRLIKSYQKKVRNNQLSHSELETTQFNAIELEDFFAVLNKNGVSHRPLFYKGFLCSLRPLQVANNFQSDIYLFDPYLDLNIFRSLDQFLKDQSVLKNQSKVHPVPRENEFLDGIKFNNVCSLFLDLTYYRTSLFVNFGKCVIEHGNFRQSLKQDLTVIYNLLNSNSLLFGNMVNNEYVKEVLDRFSKENNLVIETQGSFWFLKKIEQVQGH
ncbi:MAG TPA: hypothetical protein VLG76_02665 [Rhabdochlamydiaceae bacterium]|nr:hypothetical protein [Rhabdochlamydiaceae bacterium]